MDGAKLTGVALLYRSRFLSAVAGLALAAALVPGVDAAGSPAPGGGTVDARNLGDTPMERVVVQWRVGPGAVAPAQRTARVAVAIPGMQKAADLGGGAVAYWVPPANTHAAAVADLHSIAAVDGVESVAPDVRVTADVVPNDPLYAANQSDLFGTWGINAPAAWDTTTGDSSVTVAVIDTGITTHTEFTGRVLAGYDFISDIQVANDGDGRDANPADPGDWITALESAVGYFKGCLVGNSSWHGTHVAGTIAARGNNGAGVAGLAWETSILPVRVLGKCGGYLSDIAAAIRWAAGGTVPGVPANPTPARVLSLSLSGAGACDATTQSAINDAIGNGAIVVVAAGNSNANVSGYTPAGCAGVIAVAATTSSGTRASFSNYGAGVTLAAPGVSIESTLNDGTHGPGNQTYGAYSGTSMATPHVSGVAALALAMDPALTSEQLRALLVTHVKAFAPDGTGTSCQVLGCGAGILDAGAVVSAAAPPTDHAPVASDATLTTPANTPVDGTLVATDVDADTLTYTIVDSGSHGTAVISDAGTGAFTYTPATDNAGVDTFTFTASDGDLDSNVATVTVTITGLVGQWEMDGDSTDAAPPANNAIGVGSPTYDTGRIGQALMLDGSTQYATVPGSADLDITGPITMAAWVKPDQVATQGLLEKATNGGVDGFEIALAPTGHPFVRFNQATSGDAYRVEIRGRVPVRRKRLGPPCGDLGWRDHQAIRERRSGRFAALRWPDRQQHPPHGHRGPE